MTTRADLPLEHWQLLSDAPHWVYIIFRTAEGDGLFSRGIFEKIKESRAFSQLIETYQTDQPLIRDVLDAALAEEHTEVGLSEDKAYAALRDIAGVLSALDAAEADAFKCFLLDAAQTIAEASGEGIFGTGDKVSDSEIVAVTRAVKALGAEHLEHPFMDYLER